MIFTTVQRYLGIGALLVLIACSVVIYSLDMRVKLLTSQKQSMKNQISQYEEREKNHVAIIDEQAARIKLNQQLTTELNKKISNTRRLLVLHQTNIQKLERENAEFKNWANTELPHLLVGLRKRPDIANSADYRAWLSNRGILHAPSKQPSN